MYEREKKYHYMFSMCMKMRWHWVALHQPPDNQELHSQLERDIQMAHKDSHRAKQIGKEYNNLQREEEREKNPWDKKRER